MMKIDYILCHGSGNRFVLLDALHAAEVMASPTARLARDLSAALKTDGLLVLDRENREDGARDTAGKNCGSGENGKNCENGGNRENEKNRESGKNGEHPKDGERREHGAGEIFGMRMWNTDGSEAEMCGNGIRCVARLAVEQGLVGERFILFSGRRHYPVTCEEAIAPGLPTFGVELPLRLATDDFPMGEGQPFLQRKIGVLDDALRFSYLNPGNPHLVAEGDPADLERLAELGRRVTAHPEVFPRGMNVSLFGRRGERAIFVSTCERGVGLTASCGTAMTSAATAACLTGICPTGKTVEVLNRGGKVRCTTRMEEGGPVTRLVGNASWIERGTVDWDPEAGCVGRRVVQRYEDEERAYRAFLGSMER